MPDANRKRLRAPTYLTSPAEKRGLVNDVSLHSEA